MEKSHWTYSIMFSRDPFADCSNTLWSPPTWADPWMRTVKKPTSMTTIWNASVHTTAFSPPWNGENGWEFATWSLQFFQLCYRDLCFLPPSLPSSSLPSFLFLPSFLPSFFFSFLFFSAQLLSTFYVPCMMLSMALKETDSFLNFWINSLNFL